MALPEQEGQPGQKENIEQFAALAHEYLKNNRAAIPAIQESQPQLYAILDQSLAQLSSLKLEYVGAEEYQKTIQDRIRKVQIASAFVLAQALNDRPFLNHIARYFPETKEEKEEREVLEIVPPAETTPDIGEEVISEQGVITEIFAERKEPERPQVRPSLSVVHGAKRAVSKEELPRPQKGLTWKGLLGPFATRVQIQSVRNVLTALRKRLDIFNDPRVDHLEVAEYLKTVTLEDLRKSFPHPKSIISIARLISIRHTLETGEVRDVKDFIGYAEAIQKGVAQTLLPPLSPKLSEEDFGQRTQESTPSSKDSETLEAMLGHLRRFHDLARQKNVNISWPMITGNLTMVEGSLFATRVDSLEYSKLIRPTGEGKTSHGNAVPSYTELDVIKLLFWKDNSGRMSTPDLKRVFRRMDKLYAEQRARFAAVRNNNSK